MSSDMVLTDGSLIDPQQGPLRITSHKPNQYLAQMTSSQLSLHIWKIRVMAGWARHPATFFTPAQKREGLSTGSGLLTRTRARGVTLLVLSPHMSASPSTLRYTSLTVLAWLTPVDEFLHTKIEIIHLPQNSASVNPAASFYCLLSL